MNSFTSDQPVVREEDFLPVRMLNEYAYCPRLFHLMHVEGLWASNAYTEDGSRVHKRVDRFENPLPDPQVDLVTPHQEELEGDAPPVIARSVNLSCAELGLIAKLDLVSTAGSEAVPVETKRGKVPDNPERSWEPERVQLMAQGLLLRSHGYHCDHGYLYFAASRRRVEILFTAELESRTLEFARQAQDQAQSMVLPEPLENSPKCKSCSLSGICLPDETLALREVPVDPVAPNIRRLYPSRNDASPLYIQEQGAWVGTSKGNLSVKKGGEILLNAKLKDIDHLVLCGNVQIGTQAVALLCEAAIPIVYLSTGHWFHGITSGITLKNAYDRAAQFSLATRPHKCLAIAKSFISAKLSNQRTLLRRNGEQVGLELNEMARLQDSIKACAGLSELLGYEGLGARHYFKCFPQLIKSHELAELFSQEGRSRRPPPDPVNAMLSFGYAMLAKECSVALLAIGLDPFWGFFHQPRHGRPSLALDLMEEFRPLIVDSAVLSACNTGMVQRKDFIIGKNGCQMKPAAKKAFIKAYESRCDQLATHPILGYKVSWRVMIRLQARLLARWIREDIPQYKGVVTR